MALSYIPPELVKPEEKPMDTVIDRIKYLMYLTRLNQIQFAARIGVNSGYVSRVLTGKIPASEAFLNRIALDMHVSKRWLKIGDEVPFARGMHADEINLSEEPKILPSRKGALFYDVDVTAGSHPLADYLNSNPPVGRIDIPGIDPDSVIVKVSGNSMVPRIYEGSYIAIHPVYLSQPILWGQIYVVEIEGQRMVKYLRRGSSPATVILHSDNPDYDDIEIEKTDILRLYLVDKIINIR